MLYTSALFSAVHLLTLALGLGAVWARGRALHHVDVPAVLRADNAWGVAAVLWLVTGLTRVFGGLEKGADWYLSNPTFWVKLCLFGLIMALEVWPMATFIRWRIARGRGNPPELRHVAVLARINDVELALTLAIPFVAAAMARGISLY